MRLQIVFLIRSLIFLVFPVLAFAHDRVVLQTGNEIGAIAPGYEADFVGVAGDLRGAQRAVRDEGWKGL